MKSANFVFNPLKFTSLVVFISILVIPEFCPAQYRGVRFKHEGIGTVIEGGAYIPFELYKGAGGFNAVVGMHFSEQYYGGLTIGLDGFETDIFVPIGLDFRYFLMDEAFTPFLSFDGGYAANIDNMSSSMLFYQGSVGLRFFMNQVFAIIPSTGYRGMHPLSAVAGEIGSAPFGIWELRLGFSF